jgi:hypothetical protein
MLQNPYLLIIYDHRPICFDAVVASSETMSLRARCLSYLRYNCSLCTPGLNCSDVVCLGQNSEHRSPLFTQFHDNLSWYKGPDPV